MPYIVKEIFYTLQGEGMRAGRPAVFCRFSRCNLWSGRESDRERAICRFCDTDFIGTDGPGGGRFKTAGELADRVAAHWRGNVDQGAKPYVVCTGGEPLLQLDEALIDEMHARGFEIAIETNGTLAAPTGIDWICVSPKAGTDLRLVAGDELKLVFPQPEAPPENYESLQFDYLLIQPMDGPDRERNTRDAISYCLEHPRWRLSIQSHKYIGIK